MTGTDTIDRLTAKVHSRPPNTWEGILCNKIALYLRALSLDGFPVIWFHVPNEAGKSGARYGASLNAMGRIAGAPDYVVIVPNKILLIEAKADKGRLSPRQSDFRTWCNIHGDKLKVHYNVVYNIDDLIALLG